jgi:hypothetical protein
MASHRKWPSLPVSGPVGAGRLQRVWWRRFNASLNARSERHPVRYGIYVALGCFAVILLPDLFLWKPRTFTIGGVIFFSALIGLIQGLAAVKRRNDRLEREGAVFAELGGRRRRGS